MFEIHALKLIILELGNQRKITLCAEWWWLWRVAKYWCINSSIAVFMQSAMYYIHAFWNDFLCTFLFATISIYISYFCSFELLPNSTEKHNKKEAQKDAHNCILAWILVSYSLVEKRKFHNEKYWVWMLLRDKWW